MYCSNCGNPMPDGTQYCPMCGAAQEAAPQAQGYYPDYSNPAYPNYAGGPVAAPVQKKSSVAKYAVIGVVAVVVTILVATLCSALFGSGKEAALKAFCKAIEKGDGEAVIEAMYPDDATGVSSVKSYASSFIDELIDEYGDDLDVSYEVRKDAELDRDALEDFGDYLENTYNLDADELSKAYLMEVKLTISGEDGKDSDKSWLVSYKYDGNWYIDPDAYTSVDAIYDLKEDLS